MEPTIPEFGRFAEPSLLILVSLSATAPSTATRS